MESSTFGSEFIAMKISVELIEGLGYKLRMVGVQIQGSTNVYCDNDTVCHKFIDELTSSFPYGGFFFIL